MLPAPDPAASTAPHPRWLASRQALHRDFLAACQPPDASWLAWLGRSTEELDLDQVGALWRRAARPPGSVRPVNHLYVHVPFCKSICTFCNYERLRPNSPGLLAAWEARLVHAVETLAPSLAEVTFSTLYFGGGTPSVLPADQLRRVVRVLEDNLHLQDARSRYFELDPAMMSEGRVQALVELGFLHLSFGVQTLDEEVNRAHDRGPQDRRVVGERFAQLRAAGIHDVSCDFLLGLAGTTVDQLLAELDEALATWQPVWVDVFQLVPTHRYVDLHFGGDRAAFDAHLAPFLERGPPGVRALAHKHGYRLNDGHGHAISLYKHQERPTVDPATGWMLPQGPTAYSQQACEQRAPLHLLGLGTSARSQIFGAAWLQYRDPEPGIEAPGPARFQGHTVDRVDEGRMWLTHDLRDRHGVDRATFAGVFGQDVAVMFPAAVAAWRTLGLLAHEDAATLALRPMERMERIEALCWLIPEERLEWELGRRLGLDLSAEALAARVGLQPGPELLGCTIVGWSAGRLHLQHPTGPVTLRLRPVPGAPPAVVLERAPAGLDLRPLAARLRRALAPPR
ncbi:radical SAM protein [Myxococcota bacterium]|nr:radical SAM protein [Myxococcota bacterium]